MDFALRDNALFVLVIIFDGIFDSNDVSVVAFLVDDVARLTLPCGLWMINSW